MGKNLVSQVAVDRAPVLRRRRALIESVVSSVKRKLSARAPGRSLRMQIEDANRAR